MLEKIVALNGDAEAKKFTMALMSRIESDAAALGPSSSSSEGPPACEQLALSIFARADEADRSERGADLGTAKAFHAALTLMEVCQQFGPLSPDVR